MTKLFLKWLDSRDKELPKPRMKSPGANRMFDRKGKGGTLIESLRLKLKEKGFIWIFDLTVHKIMNSLNSLVKVVKIWLRFPMLGRTIFASHPTRILAIWDMQTVPYSIGDLLVMNEAMLCLRIAKKVERIDVGVVCDPQRPARYDHKFINEQNYYFSLGLILPVIQINEYLGSLFLFDSYKRIEDFILDNFDKYYLWPSLRQYATKTEAYALNFDFVQKFYLSNGYIPQLTCHQVMIEWAKSFIEKNVQSGIPVAVHLRNNQNSARARNSSIGDWIAFFEYCMGKFSAKFIVICSWEEIDDRLRKCPNVIIAKDYHTNIEQDLALIQVSALFMGGPSGPSTIAVFNSKPYVIVNFRTANETLIKGSKFIFANENQRVIWEPENFEILVREFSSLVKKIDADQYKSESKSSFSPEKVDNKLKLGITFKL